MLTFTTEVDGKPYIVDVHPEKRADMFLNYVQVYRRRKDGSRGLKLQSYREAAWAAWEQVRDAAQES